MTELEIKEKRWKFLNQLRRKGIDSPQSKRIAWDIMLIKVQMERETQKKAVERDYKLNQLLEGE